MIYKFPAYIIALPIVAALLFAGVAAFMLWKKVPIRFALILIALSLVAGGIFAPAIWMDQVILDERVLRHNTGFWWEQTVKEIPVANIRMVRIVTKRDIKNREYDSWHIHMKDGGVVEIDPGDLWDLHAEDITQRLRARGIDVSR
jgi:hypothetical protein